MLSIGVIVMVGGVSTMLRSQIESAAQLQQISVAKIQATYLAEMGLNHVMFEANTNPDGANPLGPQKRSPLSFKQQVAMVRDDPAGVATCEVHRLGAVGGTERLQVKAVLVTRGATYRRTLEFAVRKKPGVGEQWVLAGYNIIE